MRKEYEMSDEQFQKILDASRPTPLVFDSNGRKMFGDQQENANYAWKKLGEEMGFKYMTVQPSKKGQRFFTAESQ